MAHVWTSDGTGSFTLRALEGAEAEGLKRGTSVKIFLRDDAREYEEKWRLESVIRKHSNFLPFAIELDGSRVNTTAALWREPKFSITKEQYNDFYKFLTYDQTEPLDVVHFSVDAPVQFNCLLYIPGTALRVSQLLAALSCVVAVAALLILSFKRHNRENLYVNRVVFLEDEEDDEEVEESVETEETETEA